jgi:hypothetical protein
MMDYMMSKTNTYTVKKNDNVKNRYKIPKSINLLITTYIL